MRHRNHLIPVLTAAAFAASAAAGGAASLLSGSVADVPARSDVRDLGRALPTLPVSIAVTLNYRHAAELDRLVQLQSNPSSPLYQRYLSDAQFEAYFAPAQADYEHTATALQRAGFRITQRFSNRTVVDATAPASVAERYFSTEIHRVVQAGVGLRYANARPAQLPPELRGIVVAVAGLNDLAVVQPLYRFPNAAQRAAQQQRARTPLPQGGTPIGAPLYGPDGGYGPLATAQGYDLPVQHGYNGAGRSAGVIIWADYRASDITGYERYFGITRTGKTSKVAVDGGGSFNGNINDPANASIEAELDVETIEGNSPGANVVVYEFPSPTDQHIEDAYNAAVSANTVDVLNSSFGGCESGDPSFAKATNHIATQGAAKGITFAASSGDAGSNQCNGAKGVSSPAGDPEFMSIGGTSLRVTSKGVWSSETVWNSNGGAGGGGVSTVFALPPYQQGIGGVIASGRNQPDIALSSDPSYGTSLYFNGAWDGPVGGTSWASPVFTAYLAQVAQLRGRRAGFVNPSLYGTLTSTKYSYYHDIIVGNNFGYRAKAGYDQASGIGSIKSGNGLAPKLP
ncbi:MAG: S8/S53 family peptidase [Candidatus Eremiobacteraeota bacterium]|nr:S8/S53 family peptidase [Candidatus Eremiobacteraeota bacterium]MBC5803473.1 S8/S53 family peptidase [Candidatus Eremiobacteraeota bacterium]